MKSHSKFITSKLALAGILLLGALVVFQAQTFYGKRKVGFYTTKEDGAPFGYYVPRQIDEKKTYPLLVIFGQKPTEVMKWKDYADKQGLVVVAIQPKIGGVWNFEWDVDRALRKMKEVKGWFPVEKSKIWAMGYEKSGNFAIQMTMNHPEVFTAAAASDAKTYNALIMKGDATSPDYVDPFRYKEKPEERRPLWMMNFSKSTLVPEADLAKTKELLAKYGYVVTYAMVEGEPTSPDQKTIQKIYEWLQSLK